MINAALDTIAGLLWAVAGWIDRLNGFPEPPRTPQERLEGPRAPRWAGSVVAEPSGDAQPLQLALVTRWPDGVELWAVPEPHSSAVDFLHDFVHHELSYLLTNESSPVLRRVATHDSSLCDDVTVALHEEIVLAIQKLARYKLYGIVPE